MKVGLERLGRLVIWLLCIYLVAVVNTLPYVLGLAGTSLSLSQQWVSVGIYFGLVFVLIHFLMKWLFGMEDAGPREPQFTKADAKRLFVSWGVLLLANILFSLLRVGLGESTTPENQQVIGELVGQLEQIGKPYLTAFAISVGIFAPILEELVFRGLGPRYVFKGLPSWLIAFLVSAAFGIIHMHSPSLLDWLNYTFMGLVLYQMMAKRYNIWDSIWLHMLNNAIGAIVILLI